jgi:proteic killer suppression protein
VIKSFRHVGLEKFFATGSKAGIQPAHGKKLSMQLGVLNTATEPQDVAIFGWGFHGLKGGLDGHYAVRVNGNWRLTFAFEGKDVILLDYLDHH